VALRAVPEHPKFAQFKAILKQPKSQVIGWLEMMWHFTGRFTPKGDIGKYTDVQIEAWLEWNGEPGALVDAFVQSRWIDRDSVYRLLVHDWAHHADKATKNALKRAGEDFCTPIVRTDFQKEAKNGSAYRLPVPVPEPVPEPEPGAGPVPEPGPVPVPEPEPKELPTPASGGDFHTSPQISEDALNQGWWKFLDELKRGLCDAPLGHPNFSEVKRGQHDWNACFADWKLVAAVHTPRGLLFHTLSPDPVVTDAGTKKYAKRIARIVSEIFGCAVEFRIGKPP
jgi:hypothetical protein